MARPVSHVRVVRRPVLAWVRPHAARARPRFRPRPRRGPRIGHEATASASTSTCSWPCACSRPCRSSRTPILARFARHSAGQADVHDGRLLRQGALVILFFMHVKYEANWKYVLTIPASIMTMFLVVALVPDVGLRVNGAFGWGQVFAGAPGVRRGRHDDPDPCSAPVRKSGHGPRPNTSPIQGLHPGPVTEVRKFAGA